MKPLKKQNAKLGVKAPQDSDPEALETFAPSADSDSDLQSEDAVPTGREHYETVGKSRLRKPLQPTLGREYQGSTVSRAALNGLQDDDDNNEFPFAHVEDSGDDDPFAKGAVDDDDDSSESEKENRADIEMAVVDGEVAEDEDDEIESDEAFGDEDSPKFKSFKFRGSKSLQSLKKGTKLGHEAALHGLGVDEMDGDLGLEDLNGQEPKERDLEIDEDVNEYDQDLSGETENSDDDSASANSTSAETLGRPAAVSSDRAALKAILANDTAAVALTLSAAAASDAKKGKAVRQQYQTFDRLLDARIKLQKGLTAVNKLTQESFAESENGVAVQKAEEAALSLWTTIESIRLSLLDAQLPLTGPPDKTKKRKRPAPATTETSTSDLWLRIQSLETKSLPHHRAVLDKWSSKVRAATALPTTRSQLVDRPSQTQNNITAVLDTYLVSKGDKLIAQASINPAQSPTQTPPTYDDTPFYQSLLRDLIAFRSSTTHSNTTTAAILPSSATITRLHAPGSKTKRVDTKASKGRKVRYTIHEKLQNFAAEEERGMWEESARREFFGSLFGNKRVLDEDEHETDPDGGDGGREMGDGVVDGEAEALRLFRN